MMMHRLPSLAVLLAFACGLVICVDADVAEFTFTLSQAGYEQDQLGFALHQAFANEDDDPRLDIKSTQNVNNGNVIVQFVFVGSNAANYATDVQNYCASNDCDAIDPNGMLGQAFGSAQMTLLSIAVRLLPSPTTSVAPSTVPPPTTPAPTDSPIRFQFQMGANGATVAKIIAAIEAFFSLGQCELHDINQVTQGEVLFFTFGFTGASGTAYTNALVGFCENPANNCANGPAAMSTSFQNSQNLILMYVTVLNLPTTVPPPTAAPSTTQPVPSTTGAPPATAVPSPPPPTTSAPPQTPLPTPAPTTTTTAPTQPPQTPAPNVINFYSQCSSDTCDPSTCTDTTYDDKVCATQPGLAILFNCSSRSRCAEVQVFTDPVCNVFSSIGSLVCGSCNTVRLSSGLTRYFVDCDANGESISVHTGCAEACSDLASCTSSTSFLRNVCGGGGVEALGWTAVALGEIRDCASVTMSTFSGSGGCLASNLDSAQTQEQGFCSGKSAITCPGFVPLSPPTFAPVVTLPPPPVTVAPAAATTTLNSCADPQCSTTCSAVASDVTDDACVTLPTSLKPSKYPVISMRQTCNDFHSGVQCIGILYFSDAQCTQIVNRHALRCDSCSNWNVSAAARSEYLSCSMNADGADAVAISTDCSDGCGDCATPGQSLAVGQCARFISGGHTFFVVVETAPHSCNTVSRTYYNSSNCVPSSAMSRVQLEQEACTDFGSTACSNAAPLTPAPVTFAPYPSNTPDREAVAVATCSDPHCSESCVASTPVSGECYNATNGTSKIFTCIGGVSRCVQLQSFADASCTSLQRSYAPVCNTCQLAHGERYMIACNESSETFELRTGCDATCTTCNATEPPVAFGKCADSGSFGRVIVNSPEWCFAVQQQSFSSPSCGNAPTSISMHAQGTCNGGTTARCPFNGLTNPPTPSPPETTAPTTSTAAPSATTAPGTPPSTTPAVSTTSPIATTTFAPAVPTTTSGTPAPPPVVTPAPSSTFPPATANPEPVVFAATFDNANDFSNFAATVSNVWARLEVSVVFVGAPTHNADGSVDASFRFEGPDAESLTRIFQTSQPAELRRDFGITSMTYRGFTAAPTPTPSHSASGDAPPGTAGLSPGGIAGCVIGGMALILIAIGVIVRRNMAKAAVRDDLVMHEHLNATYGSRYD